MVTKYANDKDLNCPQLEKEGVKWCWDTRIGIEICTNKCRYETCLLEYGRERLVVTKLTEADKPKVTGMKATHETTKPSRQRYGTKHSYNGLPMPKLLNRPEVMPYAKSI